MVVTFFIIVAFTFTFYMTFYLKKNAKNINPKKNKFDEFVDKDIGYPWSMSSKRKEAFNTELKKRKG